MDAISLNQGARARALTKSRYVFLRTALIAFTLLPRPAPGSTPKKTHWLQAGWHLVSSPCRELTESRGKGGTESSTGGTLWVIDSGEEQNPQSQADENHDAFLPGLGDTVKMDPVPKWVPDKAHWVFLSHGLRVSCGARFDSTDARGVDNDISLDDEPGQTPRYVSANADRATELKSKLFRTYVDPKTQDLLAVQVEYDSSLVEGSRSDHQQAPDRNAPVDPHREDQRILAGFERAWAYTQGIGLAQAVETSGPVPQREARAMARRLCRQAVEGVNQAGERIIRGWHFSENTTDDTWKDPRLVTGATAWVVHGLGAFLSSDAYHQTESDQERKSFRQCYARALHGLTEHRQRLQTADGAWVSLMTAGWTTLGLKHARHPAAWPTGTGYAPKVEPGEQWAYNTVLDALGYDNYNALKPPQISTLRTQNGHTQQRTLGPEMFRALKTRTLAENVVTEHNLDVLNVLGQAIKHAKKWGLSDLATLIEWRDELRDGIFLLLWDKDGWSHERPTLERWDAPTRERRASYVKAALKNTPQPVRGRMVTGGTLLGEPGAYTFAPSPHSAIDNCSWLSLSVDYHGSLSPVHVDRTAACLDYAVMQFAKPLAYEGRTYYGTHYFQNSFRDPYIEPNMRQESSYHLEATMGLILGLLKFADAHPGHPRSTSFRTEALDLWSASQHFVHHHGFVYSSERIQDLSAILPSSTSALWFLGVHQHLESQELDLSRPLKNTGMAESTWGTKQVVPEKRTLDFWKLEQRFQNAYIETLGALLASNVHTHRFDTLFQRLTGIRFAIEQSTKKRPVVTWRQAYIQAEPSWISQTEAELRRLCSSLETKQFLGSASLDLQSYLGLSCPVAARALHDLLAKRGSLKPNTLVGLVDRDPTGSAFSSFVKNIVRQTFRPFGGDAALGHPSNTAGWNGTKTTWDFVETRNTTHPPLTGGASLSTVRAHVRSHLTASIKKGLEDVVQEGGQVSYELTGIDLVSVANPGSPFYWTRAFIELRLAFQEQPTTVFVYQGRPVERPPLVLDGPHKANVVALRRLTNRWAGGDLHLLAETIDFPQKKLAHILRTGVVTSEALHRLSTLFAEDQPAFFAWISMFQETPAETATEPQAEPFSPEPVVPDSAWHVQPETGIEIVNGFEKSCTKYTVHNTKSPVLLQAIATAPWIRLSKKGVLMAHSVEIDSNQSLEIDVCILDTEGRVRPGIHREQIRFTDLHAGGTVVLPVVLVMDGLVGHYSFDKQPAQQYAGVSGNAFSPRSQGIFRTRPTEDLSFAPGDAFTISLWAQRAGRERTPGVLVSTLADGYGFELRVTEDQGLEGRIMDGAELNLRWVSEASLLGEDFRHIAATWDGRGVLQVYVDGRLAVPATDEGAPKKEEQSSPNLPKSRWLRAIAVGATPEGQSYFDGLVDEVRIHRGVLDLTRIESLRLRDLGQRDEDFPHLSKNLYSCPYRRQDVWPMDPELWSYEVIPNVVRSDGSESFVVEVTAPSTDIHEVVLEPSVYVQGHHSGRVYLNDEGYGADRIAGDRIFSAGPFRYSGAEPETHYLGDPDSPRGIFTKEVGLLYALEEYNPLEVVFELQPEFGIIDDQGTIDRHAPSPGVVASSHFINVCSPQMATQVWHQWAAGDPSVLTRAIYDGFGDRFDFLSFISTYRLEWIGHDNWEGAMHYRVQNDVRGIGLPITNDASFFGSRSLLGVITLDPLSIGLVSGLMTHELLHQWGASLMPGVLAVPSPSNQEEPRTTLEGHYESHTSVGSLIGGYRWEKTDEGRLVVDCSQGWDGASSASDLDLYTMGLIPAEQIGPIYIGQRTPDSRGCLGQQPGSLENGTIQLLSFEDILASERNEAHPEGRRTPLPEDARRHYRIGFVGESNGRLLTESEMRFYDRLAEHYTKPLNPDQRPRHDWSSWASVDRFFDDPRVLGQRLTWTTKLPDPNRPEDQ